MVKIENISALPKNSIGYEALTRCCDCAPYYCKNMIFSTFILPPSYIYFVSLVIAFLCISLSSGNRVMMGQVKDCFQGFSGFVFIGINKTCFVIRIIKCALVNYIPWFTLSLSSSSSLVIFCLQVNTGNRHGVYPPNLSCLLGVICIIICFNCNAH